MPIFVRNDNTGGQSIYRGNLLVTFFYSYNKEGVREKKNTNIKWDEKDFSQRRQCYVFPKLKFIFLVVLYATVFSTSNKLLLQTCKLELFYINGSKCLYICSFVYFVLDQKGNQTQRLPANFPFIYTFTTSKPNIGNSFKKKKSKGHFFLEILTWIWKLNKEFESINRNKSREREKNV